MRRERKKLAQVARVWATGELYTQGAADAPQEQFDEALAAFGLQQSEAEQSAEEFCYLWPCNVRTYSIWQRIQTQWRRDGKGERTGLDYSGIETYLRSVERIPPTRQWAEIWAGLQAMEAAALNAWAQQQREKQD